VSGPRSEPRVAGEHCPDSVLRAAGHAGILPVTVPGEASAFRRLAAGLRPDRLHRDVEADSGSGTGAPTAETTGGLRLSAPAFDAGTMGGWSCRVEGSAG
jgi:hypothetical protein